MQSDPSTDTQSAVALLEKTPFLLETMLRDGAPAQTHVAAAFQSGRNWSERTLPEDLWHWKPAPERWSISEVLAHLVEIEDLYCGRVRRMLAEDRPQFLRYVQPDPASPNAGSQSDTVEILARFITMRRNNLDFLKTMPATAGARTGHHSELGPFTLAQMLNEWASHDLGHLRQIAELYRARAFHPHAGPFQKYSNPKP